jgi:hypothetical protein
LNAAVSDYVPTISVIARSPERDGMRVEYFAFRLTD